MKKAYLDGEMGVSSPCLSEPSTTSLCQVVLHLVK